MSLIISILMALGIISSPDQADAQTIEANQAVIEQSIIGTDFEEM